MPYYNAGDYYGRGDYYQGDYYQGDPGLLSGLGHLFGKATQFLGGLAGKVLPGPIGAAVRLALPYAAGGSKTALTSTVTPPMIVAPPPPPIGIMAPGGGGGGIITQSPLGTPVSQAAIERQVMALHAGFRRTHPNRSTYVTRGGGTSRWPQGLQVHPKGTEAVTSRRMNVGNARALRRALRRARGFAKLAHKVLRATHQFKGKGFGRAKKRR